MKQKTSATGKKSRATATASKRAFTAKKSVVKKQTVKKPLVKKTSVAPVVIEQPREVHAVKAPVAVQAMKVPNEASQVPVVTRVTKFVTLTVANAVTCRKTSVRAGDIAEGDTDKGGRFEVLVGSEKIGEVAFCSVVRLRDGQPSGFRRSWRGEDATGKMMFTDGKRMNYVVAQLVASSKGLTVAPEIKRDVPATIVALAEQVNASQGASA